MGQQLMGTLRQNDDKQDNIVAADLQARAAEFVTNMGRNTILWDSCRLIYDTADLVKEDPNPDEVAVFGVSGNVKTADQVLKPFAVRYCLETHGSARYFMSLSDGVYPAKRIEPREPGQYSGFPHFQKTVLRLTSSLEKNGVEETAKSFFGYH